MLLIQFAGGLLVLLYFQSEWLRQETERIAIAKANGGLVFSFCSGFVAGGLISEFAKIITGKVRRYDRRHAIRVAWAGSVYGLIGILVDFLYFYQSVWFGQGNDVGTLSLKTAVDMLVFTPFMSFPIAASLFAWWKNDFSLAFWREALTWRFYRDEVLASLPLGWAYWVPFLFLTYSLPQNLQFPFAMLAESAWSVLFVFMIAGE